MIIGLLIAAGLLLVILLFIIGQYVSLWFQALLSAAKVRLIDLIMMRFRRVDPKTIVFNRISAKKAGLDLSTDQLEAHYLAGGRVTNVVRAMIAADKARIDLGWDRATAIDLAGRDILDAVKTSVDPKVIDCPQQTADKATIDAVARDGTQLEAVRAIFDENGISTFAISAATGEGVDKLIDEMWRLIDSDRRDRERIEKSVEDDWE